MNPPDDATPALVVRDTVAGIAPFLQPYAVAPYAFIVNTQGAERLRWEVRGEKWSMCVLGPEEDRPVSPRWVNREDASASGNAVALGVIYGAWDILFMRAQNPTVGPEARQAAFVWMVNAANVLAAATRGQFPGTLTPYESTMAGVMHRRAVEQMEQARY